MSGVADAVPHSYSAPSSLQHAVQYGTCYCRRATVLFQQGEGGMGAGVGVVYCTAVRDIQSTKIALKSSSFKKKY